MTRGVIYFQLGTRHLVVQAISIRTLRRYWDGPITIICGDRDAYESIQPIADAGDCDLQWFMANPQRRHSGYANKPRLPKLSPYEYTLQLDADTIITGPLDCIWPVDSRETVITEYCDWVSTGGIIGSRIKAWQHIPEVADECRRQLAAPYPAINTGVVAYGNEAEVARELWLKTTLLNPQQFITDEIAMQLIYRERADTACGGDVRVMTDRWNWSPLFSKSPQSDARIIHFHGKKHIRREQGRAIWWPEFVDAWQANYANLQNWCPAGDKYLRQWLYEEVAGIPMQKHKPVEAVRDYLRERPELVK